MARTKEDIQYDLRKVDSEMRSILAKGDNLTPAEEASADKLIEQYEALNTELRRFNIGGAVHEMRQPTESPAGQGQPNAGYSSGDFHTRFGKFLQATAAAALPAGSMVGEFRTGFVDRSLLESRATGLGESQPSAGGVGG